MEPYDFSPDAPKPVPLTPLSPVTPVAFQPVVSPPPPAAIIVLPLPRHTLLQRRPLLWLVQSLVLLALSFGLWTGTLRLYSLHNDQPSNYHPDEQGKGYQLVQGERNFNHPQLMLEAALLLPTNAAADTDANVDSNGFVGPSVFRRPGTADVETTVIRARTVSAAFGAGAAVLMAWAGWAAMGWAGFLCVGAAVALCPALLSHSHFLKEDSALTFGIAAVLCAGAWSLHVRRQSLQWWTIIGLGVGCGLAASGKYCGAIMVAPAVLMALVAPLVRRHWLLALAGPLMVVAFAVTCWLGVNYRIYQNFDEFRSNFGREENHAVSGHADVTMDRPNYYFADAVWGEAMLHVKVLTILAIPAVCWLAWKRRGRVPGIGLGVWLLLTIVAYSVMLSYSVIPFYRYAMPVTVMLYAFAALVVGWLAGLLRPGWRRAAGVAAGLVVIGTLQGFRCADYTQQFADDSRDALREWIVTGLPDRSVVAADGYSMLLQFRSQMASAANHVQLARSFDSYGGAYDGTVEQLRGAGIQYMVTASSARDRYMSPYVHARSPNDPSPAQTAAFYRDLEKYPVVWSHVARHPMQTFANPDIVVYRIDAAPTR